MHRIARRLLAVPATSQDVHTSNAVSAPVTGFRAVVFVPEQVWPDFAAKDLPRSHKVCLFRPPRVIFNEDFSSATLEDPSSMDIFDSQVTPPPSVTSVLDQALADIHRIYVAGPPCSATELFFQYLRMEVRQRRSEVRVLRATAPDVSLRSVECSFDTATTEPNSRLLAAGLAAAGMDAIVAKGSCAALRTVLGGGGRPLPPALTYESLSTCASPTRLLAAAQIAAAHEEAEMARVYEPVVGQVPAYMQVYFRTRVTFQSATSFRASSVSLAVPDELDLGPADNFMSPIVPPEGTLLQPSNAFQRLPNSTSVGALTHLTGEDAHPAWPAGLFTMAERLVERNERLDRNMAIQVQNYARFVRPDAFPTAIKKRLRSTASFFDDHGVGTPHRAVVCTSPQWFDGLCARPTAGHVPYLYRTTPERRNAWAAALNGDKSATASSAPLGKRLFPGTCGFDGEPVVAGRPPIATPSEALRRALMRGATLRAAEVCSATVRTVRIAPPPPLNAATLAVEASRSLGMHPKMTSLAAAKLFELGLITDPASHGMCFSTDGMHAARRAAKTMGVSARDESACTSSDGLQTELSWLRTQPESNIPADGDDTFPDETGAERDGAVHFTPVEPEAIRPVAVRHSLRPPTFLGPEMIAATTGFADMIYTTRPSLPLHLPQPSCILSTSPASIDLMTVPCRPFRRIGSHAPFAARAAVTLLDGYQCGVWGVRALPGAALSAAMTAVYQLIYTHTIASVCVDAELERHDLCYRLHLQLPDGRFVTDALDDHGDAQPFVVPVTGTDASGVPIRDTLDIPNAEGAPASPLLDPARHFPPRTTSGGDHSPSSLTTEEGGYGVERHPWTAVRLRRDGAVVYASESEPLPMYRTMLTHEPKPATCRRVAVCVKAPAWLRIFSHLKLLHGELHGAWGGGGPGVGAGADAGSELEDTGLFVWPGEVPPVAPEAPPAPPASFDASHAADAATDVLTWPAVPADGVPPLLPIFRADRVVVPTVGEAALQRLGPRVDKHLLEQRHLRVDPLGSGCFHETCFVTLVPSRTIRIAPLTMLSPEGLNAMASEVTGELGVSPRAVGGLRVAGMSKVHSNLLDWDNAWCPLLSDTTATDTAAHAAAASMLCAMAGAGLAAHVRAVRRVGCVVKRPNPNNVTDLFGSSPLTASLASGAHAAALSIAPFGAADLAVALRFKAASGQLDLLTGSTDLLPWPLRAWRAVAADYETLAVTTLPQRRFGSNQAQNNPIVEAQPVVRSYCILGDSLTDVPDDVAPLARRAGLIGDAAAASQAVLSAYAAWCDTDPNVQFAEASMASERAGALCGRLTALRDAVENIPGAAGDALRSRVASLITLLPHMLFWCQEQSKQVVFRRNRGSDVNTFTPPLSELLDLWDAGRIHDLFMRYIMARQSYNSRSIALPQPGPWTAVRMASSGLPVCAPSARLSVLGGMVAGASAAVPALSLVALARTRDALRLLLAAESTTGPHSGGGSNTPGGDAFSGITVTLAGSSPSPPAADDATTGAVDTAPGFSRRAALRTDSSHGAAATLPPLPPGPRAPADGPACASPFAGGCDTVGELLRRTAGAVSQDVAELARAAPDGIALFGNGDARSGAAGGTDAASQGLLDATASSGLVTPRGSGPSTGGTERAAASDVSPRSRSRAAALRRVVCGWPGVAQAWDVVSTSSWMHGTGAAPFSWVSSGSVGAWLSHADGADGGNSPLCMDGPRSAATSVGLEVAVGAVGKDVPPPGDAAAAVGDATVPASVDVTPVPLSRAAAVPLHAARFVAGTRSSAVVDGASLPLSSLAAHVYGASHAFLAATYRTFVATGGPQAGSSRQRDDPDAFPAPSWFPSSLQWQSSRVAGTWRSVWWPAWLPRLADASSEADGSDGVLPPPAEFRTIASPGGASRCAYPVAVPFPLNVPFPAARATLERVGAVPDGTDRAGESVTLTIPPLARLDDSKKKHPEPIPACMPKRLTVPDFDPPRVDPRAGTLPFLPPGASLSSAPPPLAGGAVRALWAAYPTGTFRAAVASIVPVSLTHNITLPLVSSRIASYFEAQWHTHESKVSVKWSGGAANPKAAERGGGGVSQPDAEASVAQAAARALEGVKIAIKLQSGATRAERAVIRDLVDLSTRLPASKRTLAATATSGYSASPLRTTPGALSAHELEGALDVVHEQAAANDAALHAMDHPSGRRQASKRAAAAHGAAATSYSIVSASIARIDVLRAVHCAAAVLNPGFAVEEHDGADSAEVRREFHEPFTMSDVTPSPVDLLIAGHLAGTAAPVHSLLRVAMWAWDLQTDSDVNAWLCTPLSALFCDSSGVALRPHTVSTDEAVVDTSHRVPLCTNAAWRSASVAPSAPLALLDVYNHFHRAMWLLACVDGMAALKSRFNRRLGAPPTELMTLKFCDEAVAMLAIVTAPYMRHGIDFSAPSTAVSRSKTGSAARSIGSEMWYRRVQSTYEQMAVAVRPAQRVFAALHAGLYWPLYEALCSKRSATEVDLRASRRAVETMWADQPAVVKMTLLKLALGLLAHEKPAAPPVAAWSEPVAAAVHDADSNIAAQARALCIHGPHAPPAAFATGGKEGGRSRSAFSMQVLGEYMALPVTEAERAATLQVSGVRGGSGRIVTTGVLPSWHDRARPMAEAQFKTSRSVAEFELRENKKTRALQKS